VEEDECEEEVLGQPICDEEVVYADQEKSLLVCRSLSAAHVEDNHWLRNIFHTRCTSHDKVCDVIIDGKSCT
jgi:hypothetical protein